MKHPIQRAKHFYDSFNEPLTIRVDITLGNNPFLLKSHYNNTLEKEPLLVPASAAAAEEDEEDEGRASSE